MIKLLEVSKREKKVCYFLLSSEVIDHTMAEHFIVVSNSDCKRPATHYFPAYKSLKSHIRTPI